MAKSGNSSSTTNSNQSSAFSGTNASNTTMTPTNPQFVSDSVTGLQNRINGLLDTDPQSLVAGPSQLQTQAFGAAQGLGGWQPSLGTAANAATGLLTSGVTPQTAQAFTTPQVAKADAGSLLTTDLGAYENPELAKVVNTTLADFDQNAAQTRAAQTLAQAQGQKFGGSRSALTSALTEDQLARARASTDAQLRSQAFDTATQNALADLARQTGVSEFNAGAQNQNRQFNATQANQRDQFNASQANSMAQADRQRQLAAAGLLGDLSNSTATNDRADLGLLADLGGTQQNLDQARAAAPASLLQLISGLNANQPYSLFRGVDTNEIGASAGNSNTSGTSSTNGSTSEFGMDAVDFAKLAAAAAMAMPSDKRLKTDIETVGKDKAGRRVVSFRYKGEPKGTNRLGYLAQEVEKTDPHAVLTGPGGYKFLNMGLLTMPERAA